MTARLWDWTKSALVIAVLTFVMLVIEYGDNCTGNRAPWCDFLDAVASYIPVPQ